MTGYEKTQAQGRAAGGKKTRKKSFHCLPVFGGGGKREHPLNVSLYFVWNDFFCVVNKKAFLADRYRTGRQ